MANIITDHTGNQFENEKTMCKHYDIPYITHKHRLRKGWSLEKALTTPVRKPCKDYSKNQSEKEICERHNTTHASIEDMCKHWNINPSNISIHPRSKLHAYLQ
uniref:hypothetical protein n=1 Tax=Agathobacter sp. TaxID=2021311 RepID=UPI0040559D7F